MSGAPPDTGLRRPRDLSQIVDTAIRVYRLNFGEFLAIAAVTLPLSAAAAIVGGLIEDRVISAIVAVTLAIPSLLIALVAQAAIARAVADVDAGVPPDFNYVYARVLERLGTLFLTALRAVLIFLALSVTIVGIPFAFYLAVRWAFFSQTIMIESEPSIDEAHVKWRSAPLPPQGGVVAMLARFERQVSSPVLSYSAQVVDRSWWRTFGILLILGLLASLPTGVVTLIFSAAAPIAGSLASAVVAAIVLPFSAGASTLLFFDLSSRKAELAGTGNGGPQGE